MIPGRATADGTLAFSKRAGADPSHFRSGAGLRLSSIGLGTYLGEEDDATDRGFEESAAIALALGVNVFDTAVNYRGQRSERAIGRALARALEGGRLGREEVFVATKGGFLPHDSQDPRDADEQVQEEYFGPGLLAPADLAAGCHAMAPAFLEKMIACSRENLGLETIDLYYLHNPETQLQAVSRASFEERLRSAIEVLEEAAADGRIGRWGVATWDALRVPPAHPAHLSVADLLKAARDVAGEAHHFAAVQAPLNLAMPQAAAYPSQSIGGRALPLADAAAELELAFFTSASILQGRLAAADLPPEVDALFADIPAGAQRALQFPRSSRGVTSALVGASNPEHARETFGLARLPVASPDAIARLFE